MCGVGFLTAGHLESFDEPDDLSEFYTAVFGSRVLVGSADTASPIRIDVDDIESTLTRVWDFGGTIVATRDSPTGELARATVRDPSGRFVLVCAATCVQSKSP